MSQRGPSMPYRWRGIRFDAPEGRDDSTILLVDRSDPPQWNLNLRLDELPGGESAFQAYCDAQKPPEGVLVDKKSRQPIAGRPACVIDQKMRLEDGTVLRQQQAFVLDDKRVVIVTMTARSSGHAAAKDAFDRILSTLRFDEGA